MKKAFVAGTRVHYCLSVLPVLWNLWNGCNAKVSGDDEEEAHVIIRRCSDDLILWSLLLTGESCSHLLTQFFFSFSF